MSNVEGLVSTDYEGRKLIRFLREVLLLSESAIRRAKWNGRLLVNGEAARVNGLLRAGDRVTVLAERSQPAYQVRPYELRLNIPWRSDDLLIVDKPAPLASQSGKGHPDDSLENALFSELGCPADYVYRPVNRLDKGTSGLMAVALSAHEQARLQRLLHTDSFQREYLAVTEGLPPQDAGRIDLPIAKENGPTIRRVVAPDGRPCVTRYQVLRKAGSRALLSLRLETGRTHQIRVHLASLGCPVVGDFLYGTETEELPGRFALHSSVIRFPDRNGAQVEIVSPLPAELEALLDGVSEP